MGREEGGEGKMASQCNIRDAEGNAKKMCGGKKGIISMVLYDED